MFWLFWRLTFCWTSPCSRFWSRSIFIQRNWCGRRWFWRECPARWTPQTLTAGPPVTCCIVQHTIAIEERSGHGCWEILQRLYQHRNPDPAKFVPFSKWRLEIAFLILLLGESPTVVWHRNTGSCNPTLTNDQPTPIQTSSESHIWGWCSMFIQISLRFNKLVHIFHCRAGRGVCVCWQE